MNTTTVDTESNWKQVVNDGEDFTIQNVGRVDVIVAAADSGTPSNKNGITLAPREGITHNHIIGNIWVRSVYSGSVTVVSG